MSVPKKPQRVLIQFAMRKEAATFLQKQKPGMFQNLRDGFSFQGCELGGSFGEASGTNVFVTLGGEDSRFGVDPIGTVPAALQAYLGIEKYKPDLLINAGTAGGYLRHGAKIGEVFVGDRHVAFHDRRIALPLFEPYCRGTYPVVALESLGIRFDGGRAVVSTGDALDCTTQDQERIDLNEGKLKDMEAAAIGWACEKMGVPFLPVKSVTDFVDHHEHTTEQFIKNLDLATRNLAEALSKLLAEIAS